MTIACPLLYSLVAALQVTVVTASGYVGPETRVRGIDFAGEGCIGAPALASLGTYPGNGYGYDETAVDPSRQYNGRVYDPGTGFHDYGARMYWPEIGRFISVDTAGPTLANPMSFNRYSYTFNNPYKYTDPDGRTPLVVVGLACAGAGFVGSMVGSYLGNGEVNWNAATQWAAKGFLIGVTAGLGATMLADSAAISAAAATAADTGAAAAGAGTGAATAVGLGPGTAGVGQFVDKVVNSNMGHAAERAVERAGFSTIQEARAALQQFGSAIQRAGTLPATAIQDTAHTDRVIVPGFGQGGAVVYQVSEGVLKLKTVLEWRPPGG